MSGIEIKNLAIKNKVPLWKIAESFGITPQYFSVLLRHSFNDEDSKRLVEIIEELK